MARLWFNEAVLDRSLWTAGPGAAYCLGAALFAWLMVALGSGGCTLSQSGELQQQCTTATECVLPNACYVAECSLAAQCVVTPVDNTAVLEQTPNDCARLQCVIDGDTAKVETVPAGDDRPDDIACVTQYTCVDAVLEESSVGPGVTCGASDQGRCQDGACVVGCEAADDESCDDANDCTNDICNLATNECEYEAIDNVDAPTQNDGDCLVVLCTLGVEMQLYDDQDPLDDGLDCTADSCNQGQAVNTPAPLGTGCTGVDPLASVCDSAGGCVQCNADAECLDFAAGWSDTDCQTPRCVAGQCELQCEPLGVVAADQSPQADCRTVVCDGGCGYQNNVDDTDVQDDNNDCTQDLCDLGVVSHPPEPVSTLCGASGVCDGNGNCGFCNVDGDCQADTFCRDWRCDTVAMPNVCVFTDLNDGVDLPTGQIDGNCRTQRCNTGAAENQIDGADLPVDNLECTLDLCSAGTPTNPPLALDVPCTQGVGGRFCNGNGACVDCNDVTQCSGADGICDQNACNANTCEIEFLAATVNAPMACQSAMPDCQVVKCDGLGSCGASVPDDADVVDDGIQCTADSCSGGAEVHDSATVEGTNCTQNGSFCDGMETCQSGVCIAGGSPCPGHNTGPACDDSCDELTGTCTASDMLATPCDDGQFCTGTDFCNSNGTCVGLGNPCPGQDVGPACDDSCSEASGDCSAPDVVATACDDGAFCTASDTCDAGGTCVGTGDPCPGPDGDADCTEMCNEVAGMCTTPDPNGSDCGGGDICVSSVCADVRLVFVTSTAYDGDDLGSAALADAACAARASAASLPGSYLAWASDGSTSPSVRFAQASVAYVLLDGRRVAINYATLASGTHDNTIDVDELGAAVAGTAVWTGTNDDGTAAADHCVSWTAAGMGDNGAAGTTGSSGAGWSNGGNTTCDNSLRLYCVEQ